MRNIPGVLFVLGLAHVRVGKDLVRVIAFDSAHCYFARCADGVVRARLSDGTWY